MNAQENKQLVMGAYQKYQDMDMDGVLDAFDDDVECTAEEWAPIPFTGCYRGKNELADFFTKLHESQDVLRFEPTAFIAEDDRVVVTGQGKWRVRSTGREYESPWVHIFTIRDGKVSRFDQYANTALTAEAFEPLPASAQAAAAPGQH
ncbi:nuclear transport factor 2 family protein [Massilia cavernae]|nr:nuclear transport factor 2 family protein [Massilia cavernae]